MSTTVPSPEEFISSFPELPVKIESEPSFESIAELARVLKANAASVPSTLGGGGNGYLGMVVEDAVYATIAPGMPFAAPPPPGPMPPTAGMTAPQIAAAERQHKERQRVYREYLSMQNALKKQIQNAVDPVYLRSIWEEHVGFARITVRQMLQHLIQHYGNITPQSLEDNGIKMKATWNPETPFENLITQIETGRDYAVAGGCPYTERQVMDMAFNLVFHTSSFFDDCTEWERKPAAERNWNNFKTFFLEAHRRLRRQKATAQTGGYHDANAAVTMDHNEVIANLANAAVADRTAFHAAHGYYESPRTAGLWLHRYRPVAFTLVVDDFGVKYVGKQQALHLLNALKEHYEVTVDWTGSLYCGITLAWQYDKSLVDISMMKYVPKALKRFNHPMPKKPQHAPYKAAPVQYGAKVQLTEAPDTSHPLSPAEKKHIQEVVGVFLFYARGVDSTMQKALNSLSSQQATATEKTNEAVEQFLDYAATHPSATIRYWASDMLLHIHSDASYLSELKARSTVAGHFFLGNEPLKEQINNGAILTKIETLKNIMASAAEAELGGLFVNGREAIPIRTALEDLGHKQPATPLCTDNSTAHGIANDSIQQRRSKAMDMRFYWIRDRVKQGQFHVYWAPGAVNLADYHTKHHPPQHHIAMRPIYLNEASSSKTLPAMAHLLVTVKTK